MKVSRILFVAILVIASCHVFAQQDTLYSTTGDVIVGEIKGMSKSVLTFDTDYADSDFKVDWDNVQGLVATRQVIVYTSSGNRYTGNLKFNNKVERMVQLVNSENDSDLSLDEIVQIATLENGFWDRIYISIDAGYSFSSSNNLSQLSINGRANYTGDKWKLGGGFNNVSTNQDDVDPTTRNESNIDFSRDIVGKAFAFAGIDFLENSEQNLDLRTTSKLGVGYYFLRTNALFLQGSLGLANANESYGGDDPFTENSFEGLGSLEFDAFDTGDFSFRAKLSAYPSFSNKGRVRFNSDVSLKWDLPLDFYIKASILHNYDTKPIAEGVDKGDYVFQTSIGWEWD